MEDCAGKDGEVVRLEVVGVGGATPIFKFIGFEDGLNSLLISKPPPCPCGGGC